MNFKKGLFKGVCVIILFLITFFCIGNIAESASFPYDKFDWDSFLKQHKSYWVSSYCEDENDESCVDKVLKTKEDFYTRLYELLAQFDRKGYFIDDNIIIQTVFFGLTPDSFADSDKIKPLYDGDEIESSYNVDDSVSKDKYIASDDNDRVGAVDYFKNETDTLKTLLNNMIGYYKICYGYSGVVQTEATSDGGTRQVCSDSNAVIEDGKCWDKISTIKTTYFDSIGLTSLFSKSDAEKKCDELAGSYSSHRLSESSQGMEVNEELYWDFLIHNVYFDNKFQLQSYFKRILNKTGHKKMSELSTDEYKEYEDEIVEARTKIVNKIKLILDSYGDFAETPTSSWISISGGMYSYAPSSNNFWWPIGGSEVTGSGDVQMAIGEPTRTAISSRYGPRTNPDPGFHYGIDIGGAIGVDYVIAVKSGTVVYSSKTSGDNCEDLSAYGSSCGGGYGNKVIIQHNDGSYSLYAHMAHNSVIVDTGQGVSQGQVIGKVGSSGSSTGGHLHFELRIGSNEKLSAKDPLLYMSPTEPRKTNTEFVMDEDGNYVSDGSLSNAIAFIHKWEGTPKSAGDFYVAFDDGFGNVTIGWGVVPSSNSNKFTAMGVDPTAIKIGDRVSKLIVDNIEQQIVQEKIDSIKATLSNNGIVLQPYQVDALLSRSYNYNISGFVDAYNRYGTTQAMYDNYMSTPITSRGVVAPGLIRRRKAEFILFSTGNYNADV